jgi:excisionase family DNA binding protein
LYTRPSDSECLPELSSTVFKASQNIATDDCSSGNSHVADSKPSKRSQNITAIREFFIPPLSRGSLGAIGAGVAFLTVKEVATLLRVSTDSVYGLCASGELLHVRVLNAIRIAPADLTVFIVHRRRAIERL